MSIVGREPWLAPRIIKLITCINKEPEIWTHTASGSRVILPIPSSFCKVEDNRQNRIEGRTRHNMSIVTIPRACEQESEAIPSKAATALNNVRDSSFHAIIRQPATILRINMQISAVHQMAILKRHPENRKHRGGTRG